MTKLLDEAIAELRALPETEQDWAAENIRSIMRDRDRGEECRLTPEQVAGVSRTLAALDAGRMDLLTEDEMNDMWRKLDA